jgi:branched-subunit amino acid transport protein
MLRSEIILLCLGMGAVTFIPRWLPLLVLSQKELPEWLDRWLDLIPVAILSALIFPALFTRGDPRHLVILSREALVAVPTFLFALKTRSLGCTVLLGMLLYWLSEQLLTLM